MSEPRAKGEIDREWRQQLGLEQEQALCGRFIAHVFGYV